MSSNAPATAEVRTFPNAKVQPSTEAPEIPVQPAAPVAAPAGE
ncbi:MAG: HlyD family secretion protein, partial [Mesorhizobium sp.]